jgi:hypothetical protein
VVIVFDFTGTADRRIKRISLPMNRVPVGVRGIQPRLQKARITGHAGSKMRLFWLKKGRKTEFAVTVW